LIGENAVAELEFQFDASPIIENHVQFSIIYCFNGPSGSMKNKSIITVPTTGAMTTEFDDDFEF
jgi:FMN-dependent NADH-azoreductase